MLLGIDVGTSSVKAVLFDPEGARLLATAAHEYPIHHPAPDRAEQNPEDWWNGAVYAVRKALSSANAKPEAVRAIGLCGQMHGVTLLDAQAAPIGNAIIWADQRSAAETAGLIERFGADNLAQIAGTLPAAGFMISTFSWMQKHDPEPLAAARAVVLPKDYVRLKLTGEIATDISDAAATGLFDVLGRTWSARIIDELGLPSAIFPPALESSARAGRLTAEAAATLGLKAGIPVATGCADQPAQGLANGLIAPGQASVTIGSGGQVFTPIVPNSDGKLRTDPRLHVFNHAVPEMWYVLGAILSAGLSLRWLRDLLVTDYPALSTAAERVNPGSNGLLFLPYLSGERTPHMDAYARGGFIGLTHYHGRGHMARAIMEGVAFAMREALDISLSLGGQAERVIAAGGGADSDVWRHILADVFGVPLQRSLLTELTGIGAALLGGIAAGVYTDAQDAASTARYGAITEPDAARHAYYHQLYQEYQALYPRLKDSFHHLAALE